MDKNKGLSLSAIVIGLVAMASAITLQPANDAYLKVNSDGTIIDKDGNMMLGGRVSVVDTGSFVNTSAVSGTWTTTGNLTIGDGGDDIIINSDTWDVSSLGAMTGVTGLVSTGVIDLSGATSVTINNGALRGEKKCFTYAFEAPTTTENWGSKFFTEAFTITSVTAIASGSNAVGWNFLHGTAGSITTTLFSATKSASSSAVGSYTVFNDATLAASEYIQLRIASSSATIENLDITLCGNH